MEKEEEREEFVGKLPYGLKVSLVYRVKGGVPDIKIMKHKDSLLIDTEDIENLCILLLKASRKLSQ